MIILTLDYDELFSITTYYIRYCRIGFRERYLLLQYDNMINVLI